jgi:outer membrane protein
MKRMLLVMVLALAVAPVAKAQEPTPESGLMVRLRALYLGPADRSDAIPALGVPKDAITVSDKVIPEVDLSWFFNRYVAAELILTYPQEHDVKLSGAKIGTFSHLPPTLTVQGHLPLGRVKPYLGAGVNLTLITASDLAVPGVGKLELEDYSFGFAAQAGVDVQLTGPWYANADVKYVTIRSDVKAGGTKVSEVRVDPWLIGGGVGYRF